MFGLRVPGPTDSRVDTIAATPPTGYYVIIGCGTAAVVNHTTLRQTEWGKERLSIGEGASEQVLPVMHIGFIDPWLHYHEHGMGQPPYLLGLPGYESRPDYLRDALVPSGGLKSTVFGANTRHEWVRLQDKYQENVVHTAAWAPLIESRTVKAAPDIVTKLEEAGLDTIRTKLTEPHPPSFPPYRVLTVEPNKTLGFVYAHKIDICNGPGEPNVPRHPAETDDYRAARTKPWKPFESWDEPMKKRVIITGTEALYEGTFWTDRQRICVYGGGGIGLNMVERGEHENVCLDWIARRSVHDGFNLQRNDTVLKHGSDHATKAGEDMAPGESDCREPSGAIKLVGKKYKFSQLSKLNPKSDKWRFGALVTVDTMARDATEVEKLNIVLAGSRGSKAAAKTTGGMMVRVNDTAGSFKVTAVTQSTAPSPAGVTEFTVQLTRDMPDRVNPNVRVRNGGKLTDPHLYNGRPAKGDTITLKASTVGEAVLAPVIKFYDLHEKEVAKFQTRQPLGPGTKLGDFEVLSGKDAGDNNLCPIPPTGSVGVCVSCGFGANDAGAIKELVLKYKGTKPANVRVLNGSQPGAAELYNRRVAPDDDITINTDSLLGVGTLAADLAFKILPDNDDNNPVIRDAFEEERGVRPGRAFPVLDRVRACQHWAHERRV